MTSPMNMERTSHGMGIVKVNGKEKVAAFGGYYGWVDNNVELYDPKTQKWEYADDLTLSVRRTSFGFVNV